MANTILQNYYKKRLKELGLKEADNKQDVIFENKTIQGQLFFCDEKENGLKILYLNADGSECQYDNNGKLKQFYRIRKLEGDKKYTQQSGSGIHTYFSKISVKVFKQSVAEKQAGITVFITEGEFKAISLDHNLKLVSLGIGGINSFVDKTTNDFEPELKRWFETVQPENVVLLFDADLFKLEYKEDAELTKRLSGFFAAVEKFGELAKPYNFDMYFSHVSEKYQETSKGIDDLIFNTKATAEITKELLSFTTGKDRNYINCIQLNSGLRKLKEYFCLDSVHTFYERYKNVIHDREFKYLGGSFYFDGEKVQNNYYKHALSYLRIGTDFYKKIWKINPHKDTKNQYPEQILMSWNIGEINRDFGENKKFVKLIPKFDNFINLPCNDNNYRKIIPIEFQGIQTIYYNRYQEVKHDIKQGDWSNIEQFLKHIFNCNNTNGENLYNFGLQYLKLSFEKPMLRLPVLCFVSRERNTGKTTFLRFLRLIFKENVAILDNERFTGRFTSHFADKLFVTLDEGFIPIEQKIMKERIKNFSTGNTQWLEGKGKDAKEVDNFCHLILTSNEEQSFMQIDEGENRFAVIKVNTLNFDNPRIIEDMEKEIPHFLHYLINEFKYVYELNKSRFQFDAKIYETETLLKVTEKTRPRWQQELLNYITEILENITEDYVMFTPSDLSNAISEHSNYKIEKTKIKDFLQDDLKLKPEKLCKYTVYSFMLFDGFDEPTISNNYKAGTPYKFEKAKFIKTEKMF